MTRAGGAKKRAEDGRVSYDRETREQQDLRRAKDLLKRAATSRSFARQLEADALTMVVEATVILSLYRRPVGDV